MFELLDLVMIVWSYRRIFLGILAGVILGNLIGLFLPDWLEVWIFLGSFAVGASLGVLWHAGADRP